jgi:hypothetical protein
VCVCFVDVRAVSGASEVNTAVVISLIGLIVIITAQVVFFARWTGRIDGYISAGDRRFSEYIAAADRRFQSHEQEIQRLRDARHVADGAIQRHDGILKELTRREYGRRHDDSDGE